ncbi:hypothetical protein BD311DRAFT_677453, partial [Dichomitus squalens]
SDVRGVIIAEGDVLVLCIRLFSELLLGRYALPCPPSTDSPISRLAHAIMDKHAKGLAALPGGHRSADAEYYILPQAESAIIALGHAMAYAAARDSGRIPQPLLALYETSVMRAYSAWFSEDLGVPLAQQRQQETDALRAALPDLPLFARELGVGNYVRSSILDDATWERSVRQMTTYVGTEQGSQYALGSVAVPESIENVRARL